ncbi:PRP38 family domain-containing protein [Ditylenchus destructor]|uniref:Pre-mRNA-splicing factor 38 n=1 Tax=Ditylenchus destructor TaxID=166010 RepID=A0AAD4N654_9BILA|nr:PRP38 family domain-containing protein [Ditylenchus destructor]
MANRTARDAATVKGTNPQYLVEKIIRTRIYDSVFWKEQCFGLSAETVVDKGAELRYIGGVYGGNNKPTPFLCLTLKLLQLQPDKEIIIEFIRQQDFKYLRALGAMYIRLTFSSVEVYKYLEPLFNDFRKLRYMDKMGKFSVVHMDEFIDYLLRETHYCDIQLPRLQKRQALEETDQLELYNSALDEDLDNLSSGSEDEVTKREKPRLVSRRRSRSRSRSRGRDRSRERDKDRDRDHRDYRDRERDRDRSRERKRRSSPDRDRRSDRHTEKSSSSRRKDRDNDEEREIEEQNALRAKLGMAPLER